MDRSIDSLNKTLENDGAMRESGLTEKAFLNPGEVILL